MLSIVHFDLNFILDFISFYDFGSVYRTYFYFIVFCCSLSPLSMCTAEVKHEEVAVEKAAEPEAEANATRSTIKVRAPPGGFSSGLW